MELRLRARDILIFEALQRHGPLSSLYLYEFTKHLAKDRYGFIKRLKFLNDSGLIERPLALNDPRVFIDYKMYVLTDKGRKLIKEYTFSTPASGGYPHMVMTAAITASIELGCIKAGLRYIDQEEILTSHKCPDTTRTAKKPLSLPSDISWTFTHNNKSHSETSARPTEPDQLFGIEYPDGCRFFAVEADRATESVRPGHLTANSILRKLLAYRDITNKKSYRQLGIPNLYTLIVTTGEARFREIVELAKEVYPASGEFMLMSEIPGFNPYQKTPSLYPQLFGKYKKVGGEFDISKA